MRGLNPTLCDAIRREMKCQPDVPAKEWFAEFMQIATDMRDGMKREAAAEMTKTIAALDRILEYCRTGK